MTWLVSTRGWKFFSAFGDDGTPNIVGKVVAVIETQQVDFQRAFRVKVASSNKGSKLVKG